MFKIRGALFGALALLVLSGVAASAASAAGPYWHVNGARLETGSKEVALKAGATELKATVLGVPFVILCEAASSAGATITGNGENQGQDSAKSITFEKCRATSSFKACTVENVKTVPVKSHLVLIVGTEGIGDLIEPTSGSEFTKIVIKNPGVESCPFKKEETFPVKGSTVARVSPEGSEAATGELSFPAVPITEVKKEGETRKVGLFVSREENKASFSGNFEAKLTTGEKFGVFKT
jgi:hypothetical protein